MAKPPEPQTAGTALLQVMPDSEPLHSAGGCRRVAVLHDDGDIALSSRQNTVQASP